MDADSRLFGDKAVFAIWFRDIPVEPGEERLSELSMYVRGCNILGFTYHGGHRTTQWNLDDLVAWLRSYALDMQEDPYPVDADGCCAALQDINARNYDTDDDAAFDAYYDRLYDWVHRHNWHAQSAGAILASVYFERKGEWVEISWNNEDADSGVAFDYIIGWRRVPFGVFHDVLAEFLRQYGKTWESEPTELS